MGKRFRSSKEIDIDVLSVLSRKPNGVVVTTLARSVGLRSPSYQQCFSRLEEEGMIVIELIQHALHGKGKRLLSESPKTSLHRIVKITEKGRLFLNNQILKPSQANRTGFLFSNLTFSLN